MLMSTRRNLSVPALLGALPGPGGKKGGASYSWLHGVCTAAGQALGLPELSPVASPR